MLPALLSSFLWKVMRYVTFVLLLNLGRACLFVFNIKKFIYKCKSPFHNKSEMNTPQAEGM